jgi:multidrug efflux system membrane fusion protein
VTRLIKRSLALAAAAAVVAVFAYVSLVPGTQKQAGNRAKMLANLPVPILDAAVQVADVPVYLNGVGTAKARNTVTVRAQVDGRILSINFKEGQDVKKGDVLVTIDPATYQAQLDQAIAKKALDEAQLANAQRDLERYARLPANVVAEKTIDTQRALVAQLTAQLRLDDAAIANAKAYLDYTTIVSPIDGRTGIRMVDVGNLVRGTDAASGIVVITEIRPISVIFTLPQQQLPDVNAALARGPVTVEALNTDGKTVLDRGTLQVVDNQVDPNTGTVRMKAEFPNADYQLWPGQFTNVRVLVDTLKQVVVVPTPAVQRGPSGTFAYVLQADDTVAQRPITVGLQNETIAVVKTGVSRSERVVTTGFARLKDGSRVIVTREGEPAPGGNGDARPTAKAQGGGNVRVACAADVAKLCANVERTKEAMRACLQANAGQLSDGCRAATAKGAERKGGKPREADARAPERSSTQ